MKRSELKECPEWLRDAIVENENVEIVSGRVIWHNGVWHNGDWRGGDWLGGWTTPLRAAHVPLIMGDRIRFGCEENTVEKWQAVADAGKLDGFNSEQFERLKISFQLAKKYIKLTNKK